MPTPVDKKKKEVIAALADRTIRAELKKKDFYRLFFDKIKDREICTEDQIVFAYSVELKYDVTKNDIKSHTSEMLALIPHREKA